MSQPPYLVEIINYSRFLEDLPFISRKKQHDAIARILDVEARARKILDETYGTEGEQWRFDDMDASCICVVFMEASLAIRFKLSWTD